MIENFSSEFPDKIEIETIIKNEFTGISYQDVKRIPKVKTKNDCIHPINPYFLRS